MLSPHAQAKRNKPLDSTLQHNVTTGSTVWPRPFPEVPTKRQMPLHLFAPSWARWSWASQLIGPWTIVAPVGGRPNDCKTFKTTLVGVQWYSVLVSQPHSPFLLAGIQVPQHQNNKFRGGHVSTGNSPFPQPEGRRPSCAMVPNWCWFPLQPLIAWGSTSGWLQKVEKLQP